MNARLEAFCDAVFAFALTLLIVDVRIPDVERVSSAGEVWMSLRTLAPTVCAFLLSFTVIFITWVNHHNTMKLVSRSSTPFIYGTGLLLLTVVCLPFTTAFLGAFVLTDRAAPAVALYDAGLAAQGTGWLAVTGVALRYGLCNHEHAVTAMRARRNRAYGAIVLYSALALLAIWLPLAVALITTATWLFWLALSLSASPTVAGEL